MKRMSFAEYAAHRGVSRPAVTYAVQRGKIPVHTDEKGERYLLAEEADDAWTKNAEPFRGRRNIGGKAVRTESPDPEPATAPQDSGPPSPGSNIPPLYQSKAIKEAFFARAAKLKYETDMGKVVPAEEVKSRWDQIVSISRTKILGIPSKMRQRVPEMSHESYLILEEIVREALEELADAEA